MPVAIVDHSVQFAKFADCRVNSGGDLVFIGHIPFNEAGCYASIYSSSYDDLSLLIRLFN